MPENTSTSIVLADQALASALGLTSDRMIATVKAQCFKNSRPDQISAEQVVAYVQVAGALRQQAPNFNPILPGMLYAFPTQNGGIEPMIGPDGIFTLLASSPVIVGGPNGEAAWHCEHGKDADGAPTCTAYIRHRDKGTMSKTIWVDEWRIARNPNWTTRPRHMAEIRALKQCARQIIHGIPMDEDELSMAKMGVGFANAHVAEAATDSSASAGGVAEATAPAATAAKPGKPPPRRSSVKADVSAAPAGEAPPIDISATVTVESDPAPAPAQAEKPAQSPTTPPPQAEKTAAPTAASNSNESRGALVQGEQRAESVQNSAAGGPSFPCEVIGAITHFHPGRLPDATPVGIFTIETPVYSGKAYSRLNPKDAIFHKGLEKRKDDPENPEHEDGETPPVEMQLEETFSKKSGAQIIWITAIEYARTKPAKPAAEEVE